MENTEVTKIPFEVNRIPDDTKLVGEEVIVQDGVDGTRTLVTVDGNVMSDRTVAPKNAVVYYGTKEVEDVSTSESPREEVTKQTPQNDEMGVQSYVPPITGFLNQSQGRFSKINDILTKVRNFMNSNALLVRAFKTFVQAFLATWALTNFDLGQAALVGAGAAGFSAVMNLFIKPTEA